jgi:predicted permease
MYWLRRLLLLLPWRRRERARQLEEEMRSNLALALDDAAQASEAASPEAARLVRRDFGNLAVAHQQTRSTWMPGWDALRQDIRFSVRALLRAPAFTGVAVLSLALGIGAAAALFSLVNTVVLKPLSYREPGRLLYVREVVKPLQHIYPTLPVNYQHFLFWRENAQSFESIAALNSSTALLGGPDAPETVGVGLVSSNFFEALGVTPAAGRAFLPHEELPGAAHGVVITDGLWRRRFGASPSTLGGKIVLTGSPYEVVGILPPSFRFPKNGDLGSLPLLPERTDIFIPIQSFLPGWAGDYDYLVFARLRRGVTEAQGAAELNLLEKRLVDAHPEVAAGLTARARPLQDVIASPVRAGLLVLLSAVLLLVLIVCVNLANLLLARGSARSREYSLRIALGAARGRLVISALVETLLLSLAGAALGIAGARAAVSAFARLAPIDLPRADEAQVDFRVLAFALGLAMLCALLFGLLPALRLSQADPQTALRRETHGVSPASAGLRLRESLVSGEVALSALLLVLAGLLVTSLWRVLQVDRGFATEHTLVVEPALPAKYGGTDVVPFMERALASLRALPGVRSAAVINRAPLAGESNVNDVEVDGSTAPSLDPASRQRLEMNGRYIGDDYFATAGIPLLRGRAIDAADREHNVVDISARLAARLFPGRDPIGHRVTCGSGIQNAAIVGVVGDVFATELEHEPTMMIYAPYWKSYAATILVRSAVAPETIEASVRRAIQSLDSGIPAPKIRTMQQMVDRSVAQRRFQMDVAAAFGIAALLLAALGIYGVVAYGISLRRRELGVRMALGATAGQVRGMVVWQGLRPVAAGLAIGLAAALVAGQLVSGLLFGVKPSDALTLIGTAAILAGVALLACLLPAHSATRIDPARVLREE